MAQLLSGVWNSKNPDVWKQALQRYWSYILPANLALEREMDRLDSKTLEEMDAEAWYKFLLEKYFRWKYTAPNRYASTTAHLKECPRSPILMDGLRVSKERLFSLDKADIKACLTCATTIPGLGTAGGSGLLAVLFPEHFGTVDQFAVKALRQLPDLPEKEFVASIRNPEAMKVSEGVGLIEIMRRKAAQLRGWLSSQEWTPRKIDMILWTYGHEDSHCS
jgi:hypothetical protein